MHNVAIIGCGKIAEEHAKAYKECRHTNLICAIDLDMDRMLSFCDRWDIKIGGGDMTMMGELGIEIVSICTPPESHRSVMEFLILCNPSLKGIYCEKPIATTLEDADWMIARCDEKNIILQVNHQRRWGELEFHFARGVLNTGTHLFDLLNQYMGVIDHIDIINGVTTVVLKRRCAVRLVYHDGEEHFFKIDIPISLVLLDS